MSGIYDDGACYGSERTSKSSAREELLARLTGALIPEDRANKMIDDLLHEEAEKVRDMERRNAWPERQGIGGAVLPRQVADFIDPYTK